MPARNRNRQPRPVDRPRRTKAGPKSGRPKPKSGRNLPDPSDTPDSEVRHIQPYQATKTYLCPGCHRDIPPGLGHLVAIPPDAPDLRRHWHKGCWQKRSLRGDA